MLYQVSEVSRETSSIFNYPLSTNNYPLIYYITHNEKIYDPNSYIGLGVGFYPMLR